MSAALGDASRSRNVGVKTVISMLKILKTASKFNTATLFWLTGSRMVNAATPVLSVLITSWVVNAIVYSLSQRTTSGIVPTLLIFGLFKVVSILLSSIEGTAETLFLQKTTGLVQMNLMRGVAEIPLEDLESSKMQDELYFIRTESALREGRLVANFSRLLSNFVSIASVLSIAVAWGGRVECLVLFSVLPVVYANMKSKKLGFLLSTRLARLRRENYYYNFLMTGVSSIRELAVLQATNTVLRRYYSNFIKIYRQTARFNFVSAGLNSGALVIGTSLILAVQLWIIQSGIAHKATAGQVIALFQSVSILLNSLDNLISTISEIYNDALFTNRMSLIGMFGSNAVDSSDRPAVMDEPPPLNRNLTEDFELSLKEVEYRRGFTTLFSNVTLTIRSGDRIGIVGSNGRGKTTLCEVIAGIRKPTKGEVLLNGVTLSQLSFKDRHEFFSIQFQDFTKFELRYLDNIDMENQGIQDDAAMIKQRILEIDPNSPINSDNELLYSTIGQWFENSRQLSGGQWQRLVLYRTLYRQVPVYILDEPTSSLDDNATSDFVHMILRIPKQSAVIIVSHDAELLGRLGFTVYELNQNGLTFKK